MKSIFKTFVIPSNKLPKKLTYLERTGWQFVTILDTNKRKYYKVLMRMPQQVV